MDTRSKCFISYSNGNNLILVHIIRIRCIDVLFIRGINVHQC